jgi:hypothetical protein
MLKRQTQDLLDPILLLPFRVCRELEVFVDVVVAARLLVPDQLLGPDDLSLELVDGLLGVGRGRCFAFLSRKTSKTSKIRRTSKTSKTSKIRRTRKSSKASKISKTNKASKTSKTSRYPD